MRKKPTAEIDAAAPKSPQPIPVRRHRHVIEAVRGTHSDFEKERQSQ
jgi:hypothetical protein